MLRPEKNGCRLGAPSEMMRGSCQTKMSGKNNECRDRDAPSEEENGRKRRTACAASQRHVCMCALCVLLLLFSFDSGAWKSNRQLLFSCQNQKVEYSPRLHIIHSTRIQCYTSISTARVFSLLLKINFDFWHGWHILNSLKCCRSWLLVAFAKTGFDLFRHSCGLCALQACTYTRCSQFDRNLEFLIALTIVERY